MPMWLPLVFAVFVLLVTRQNPDRQNPDRQNPDRQNPDRHMGPSIKYVTPQGGWGCEKV